MQVKDIMSSPPVTVSVDMLAKDVAALMQSKDIGAVVVVDAAGMMRGIITESDFTGMERCVPFTFEMAPVIFGARAATIDELKRIYEQAAKLPARQIMTERVYTTRPGEEVGQVVRQMLGKDLKHVPVLEGGKPVGMVARHDVLKLLTM